LQARSWLQQVQWISSLLLLMRARIFLGAGMMPNLGRRETQVVAGCYEAALDRNNFCTFKIIIPGPNVTKPHTEVIYTMG
jgi:hypothetical protein